MSMDKQIWLVSVDMGYGHQRAAYPLRGLACERIITANGDKVVGPREKAYWENVQRFYEGVSRARELPLVGQSIWRAYDRLQRIAELYPSRDLSRATHNVRHLDWLLRRGLGRGVAEYARTRDIPFVSTFFVPALAAARAGLPRIFCIVTDVDINRIWVARDPARSPIVYLCPSDVGRRRLLQYGVPPERVLETGFPLPDENVATLREDLARRLARLDPQRTFHTRFGETLARELGPPQSSDGPLTITYCVGGAGAQRTVAADILAGLAPALREGRIRLNLVAGTRLEVRDFFLATVEALGLHACLETSIHILVSLDKRSHFEQLNERLRTTDVLWTKPSELVFYAGLGLPILMTPPLGAHEERNRDWILRMGAGFPQENPRFTSEWLGDWLAKGMLAEAAFNGYLKAPRHGTENIRRVIFADDPTRLDLPRQPDARPLNSL
jgi:hypothetical protein